MRPQGYDLKYHRLTVFFSFCGTAQNDSSLLNILKYAEADKNWNALTKAFLILEQVRQFETKVFCLKLSRIKMKYFCCFNFFADVSSVTVMTSYQINK